MDKPKKCTECKKKIKWIKTDGLFRLPKKTGVLGLTVEARQCDCGTIIPQWERERVKDILDNFKLRLSKRRWKVGKPSRSNRHLETVSNG